MWPAACAHPRWTSSLMLSFILRLGYWRAIPEWILVRGSHPWCFSVHAGHARLVDVIIAVALPPGPVGQPLRPEPPLLSSSGAVYGVMIALEVIVGCCAVWVRAHLVLPFNSSSAAESGIL